MRELPPSLGGILQDLYNRFDPWGDFKPPRSAWAPKTSNLVLPLLMRHIYDRQILQRTAKAKVHMVALLVFVAGLFVAGLLGLHPAPVYWLSLLGVASCLACLTCAVVCVVVYAVAYYRWYVEGLQIQVLMRKRMASLRSEPQAAKVLQQNNNAALAEEERAHHFNRLLDEMDGH